MPGLHKGAIGKWPFLPRYLQEAFIRSFSRELLTDPGRRIIDQKWLQLFIRLRGEIFKCPCGDVDFADPVNPNPCPECGKKNRFAAYIKTPPGITCPCTTGPGSTPVTRRWRKTIGLILSAGKRSPPPQRSIKNVTAEGSNCTGPTGPPSSRGQRKVPRGALPHHSPQLYGRDQSKSQGGF